MNLKVDKSAVVRFLNGEMPLNERRELEAWIHENDNNKKYFDDIRSLYEAAHKELNEIAGTDKEWKKFAKRIENDRRKKPGVFRIMIRVAAILLLPVIGLGLFFFYSGNSGDAAYSNEKLTVVSPLGQKSKVILPDSTVVRLNSGSQLSYTPFAVSSRREVTLSGEAYFEVTRDEKHPFVVVTKDYEIKVLGTKFNVRSYDCDKATETALEEGKVVITFSNGRNYELIPGQVALASNTANIEIKNADIKSIVCWKNNVLRFSNTPVKKMIPMLEHWYGVSINVKNMEMAGEKCFTMTLKTESLNEALQLIKFVTPIKFSVKGDNVEIEFLDI